MDERDLGDRRAQARVSEGRTIGAGFRTLERHAVALDTRTHGQQRFERDMLRSGPVVGVLPIDLAQQRVVLIRQFRVAAALAADLGDMIEIVAGRQDPGESAEAAARRECVEEIGAAPRGLLQIMRFMPAPALTDEVMTLFLADLDSGSLPEAAGLADEHEFIQPFGVTMDQALAALDAGRFLNAPLIISLQWLRANRPRLAKGSSLD